MKRGILYIGLMLISKLVCAQQNAQYSQYMFNGIYINPAYAGYKEVLNLHGYYRAQWAGVEGAPRSFSVAVDGATNEGNVGLALQLASDKLGAQSSQSVYASYAYRIRMNGDGTARLAFGISGGLVQLGINGALLATQDPELDMPGGNQSTVVPDARAGVYYADERFYAGLSVDNLISPHINKSRYIYIPQPKPHYYLTAGVLLPLSESIQLKPSFLLKDDRGGPSSLDLTAFLLFGEKIWLGGSYRTGIQLYDKDYLQKSLMSRNAAVAAIEIFPLQDLRVGYAYDFSIGPFETYSHGSHEISIGVSFPSAGTKASRQVSCPKVF